MESEEVLGLVSGKSTTTEFSFNIRDVKKVQRNQYILALDSNDGRKILAHVKKILVSGNMATAICEVLGEVVDGKLVVSKRPITIGSKVIKPPSETLAEILARVSKDYRLYIGRVFTQTDLVPVYFNPKDFARHMVIVATTGGGKSYSISVFIEELLRLMEKGRKDFAIVLFDVHNEYGGLALPNNDERQVEKLKEYGLKPRGFADQMLVFDWEVNPIKLRDDFDPERLLFLYNVKELRYALYLKEIIGERGSMPLDELLVKLEVSDLHHQTKQALVTRIRALKESGLFSKDAPNIVDLLEPGKIAIIRLANAPLGDYGVRFIVADILRGIFNEAKKRALDFNVLVIIDEAHLFAPKKGKIDAVRDVIERVSREGRKYGVWLILATQSPRDLSDTVIINCSSILALKMLRKDISEFAKIFDIPKEIAEILIDLPPGRGYLKAPSLTLPILLEIRARMSREVKGSIKEIEEIEKKVMEIAKKTKDLIRKKLGVIEEEKEVKELKSVEEVVPLKKEVEEVKRVKEVKPEPIEVKKVEKVEKKVIEKKVEEKPIKKIEKIKPIEREEKRVTVLKVDSQVLEELADDITMFGYGAKLFMKELLVNGYMSVSEALAMIDERILDTLMAIGLVEKRGRIVYLALRRYLEKILGKKISSRELLEMKKLLLEKLNV